MSKRNFTLLIIVLIIITAIAFWFFYFMKPSAPSDDGEGGINFLSWFNPFGSSTPTPTPEPSPSPTPTEEPETETTISKLKRVSSMPVAGFTVFQKERFKEIPVVPPVEQEPPLLNLLKKPIPPTTEFVPALRYVAKATGNIYQTFADNIDERKFSSTVIPKVHEAYFGNKGNAVIMRYLKTDARTIQTFVGILPKELLGGDTSLENEVVGSFLPDNITDISLSADTLKMFYLFNVGTDADTAIGTTLDFLNNKKAQIFESPFTEWLSSWPNSKIITLTTKPAANVPGQVYAIDLNTKAFSKILGGINGLTTLASPSGNLMLYSDNNLSLSLYNTITKASTPLGLKTLPEKCVWGSGSDVIYCAVPTNALGGGYPDPWYQGEVSFADQLWKINALDGITRMILDPTTVAGGEITDGIKLALDEKQNYLFFINKKNSYLWELKLN
ncbi:hypothetical protein A3C67_01890 [Candidatus Nomurabacteria bacterium RIFCSPHIGHO2_02_FULL_42_19]|uniref:Uncharacterized protein n=1 Tax=Candidatus Nomurabacteria bacterium RIFCSPHIGHO2_02_FULL_42_19 TaxID=1801756 RepID=A0A1F6W2H9_9BACT|nr:MAG: hypothetical protein A3C67_01890 [Candidatus Nomurabacteria bacterium RIFCSPHIGHO2_02_FULL_42_19]